MVFKPASMPHRQIEMVRRINECCIDSDDVASIFGVVTSIPLQFLRTFWKSHAFLNLLHQLIVFTFGRAGTCGKAERRNQKYPLHPRSVSQDAYGGNWAFPDFSIFVEARSY